MTSLALPMLVAIFVIAAGVVWWSGIRLSNATDVLDRRFGWGDALGGLVLLAIATNLPEIAIVISSARNGDIGLATGNLLGGIAMQTLVLAVLDIAGGGTRVPLTSRTSTLVPVVEATMVIVGLTLLLLGSQIDSGTIFRMEPIAVITAGAWIAGLTVVRRANAGLDWHLESSESNTVQRAPSQDHGNDEHTTRAMWMFGTGALLTLAGGVVLERASDAIASDLGIGSIVFGATALAAATSIPEIATGIQAVRLGDHQLAISDIFGGNAFLPVLFLLMGILSGNAAIAGMTGADIYLAALGIVVTGVYLIGLVFRGRGMFARMGFDSLLVIIVFAIGMVGLARIGG